MQVFATQKLRFGIHLPRLPVGLKAEVPVPRSPVTGLSAVPSSRTLAQDRTSQSQDPGPRSQVERKRILKMKVLGPESFDFKSVCEGGRAELPR